MVPCLLYKRSTSCLNRFGWGGTWCNALAVTSEQRALGAQAHQGEYRVTYTSDCFSFFLRGIVSIAWDDNHEPFSSLLLSIQVRMIWPVLGLCEADSLQGPALGRGPVRAQIAQSAGPGPGRGNLSLPAPEQGLLIYVSYDMLTSKEVTWSLPSPSCGMEMT